jgi:hypothetical protein
MAEKTSARKQRPSTVYRDPIYGIPHFHDPGLSRIVMKHDPSYHVSESMKIIFVKSDQRLRAIQGNRPKYLHSRFNMDTLTTSPLMVFPHFQDMTAYLGRWFNDKDARQKSALTSHQRATFQAQERFSNGLFLLLQESARAAPVSPKPLKGIYNWYLQRDSVINQSRTIEKKVGLDEFVVIELSNGQEIRVPRSLLDSSRIGEIESLFNPQALKRKLEQIEIDPPPEIQTPPIAMRTKQTEVITSTTLAPTQKRGTSAMLKRPTFDFDQLHSELEEQRRSDRDVAAIARIMGERRRTEITRLEGWQ